MKKLLFGALIALLFLGLTAPADAHRSGCHRWHSCPSDTGSYACGDLGYCSQCSDNYYCRAGVYSPGWQERVQKSQAPAKTKSDVFVGVPRTLAELYRCAVVGNYNSMIYHLKGSSYIPKMTVTHKECFATEGDAVKKGFRKAKAY